MKNPTIVFPEPRKVVIEDRPLNGPSPGQVIIRAERTLISTGTELTVFSGEFPPESRWAGHEFPFVPGYNHVGKVVALGEGVDASWTGRRVATHSGHALYAAVPVSWVRPVAREVSPDHASFFTIAEIVMNGVRRGRVGWGEAVAVYGLGLLGQLTVDFCRLAGARPVIGIDVAEARITRLPKAPGVAGLNPAKSNLKERVSELTGRRLADVVFEVTGNPEVIPKEFDILRPQGRMVVLSSPRGPSTIDLHDHCNAPSYTIIGAHNMSHPRHATPDNPWTQQRHCDLFISLVADGEIDVERLISHRVPYTEAPAMYEMLMKDRSATMGVVLNWEKGASR